MHLRSTLTAAIIPTMVLCYGGSWADFEGGSMLAARDAFAEAEADAYADAYEEAMEYLYARGNGEDPGAKLKELQEQRAKTLADINSAGIKATQRYYKDAERQADAAGKAGNAAGARLHAAEVAYWRKMNNAQNINGDQRPLDDPARKKAVDGHEQQVDNWNRQAEKGKEKEKKKEDQATRSVEARGSRSPEEQAKIDQAREARKKSKQDGKVAKERRAVYDYEWDWDLY